MASPSAIIIMHNHPSGYPTPSEGNIKVTRDLIRAGQILKIEILDHMIIGEAKHVSLRALGYFTSSGQCRVTGAILQKAEESPFLIFVTRHNSGGLMQAQQRFGVLANPR